MKKAFLSLIVLAIGMCAMAQQSIQLRSADKAECVKSDMTSLKASFSFSTITAEDYASERGTFSWLSMANTVIGGNEGDPQIPVINELIAVPFGANPYVEIKSYSTTDYRLEGLGIHTLVPRQPSLRKDQRPEDVPFIMNEAAYRTRGFRSEPRASVTVDGIMRGVQLGKLTIEPVSYDPVNNTLRVFNDIEVEVHFDGADAQATEKMLLDTYSPYFDVVYNSLFNGRGVRSVYDQHPDLYRTPVKMLVVTTSTYTSSTAFQNWLTWKKQKGIDVDIYTVTSSTSSSNIRSGIQSRYNTNHPSFLVIIGDETVVPYYSLWDYGSTYGDAANDLEYASVDGDIYHDMFLSRMPVASTTQLGYLVDKILMYEKYTMPDPSYLNETLLVAGWDSQNNWTNKVGKQTIQYANNNYFNAAHGITPYVHITTRANMTGCYAEINHVGFVNYTAHGDIQAWSDPEYTNSNVNSMTNTGKPFWAMGNCCLTANFKNAQNSQTCFGETMVRAQNKAAFGYIGSVVESYWFEDFYFGVGAFAAQNSTNNNPTLSGTTTGAYDAMFDDTGFNTLNSVPYIGNIAVSYAYAQNYNTSNGCSQEYYWRCYQCFGDGSVMPYLKVPDANTVSHASQLAVGATLFNVSADERSYVSITVNNEIIGTAEVPAGSTSVNVPITAQTATGTAMIVVTRNQRQPYITTIPIVNGIQYTITASASPAQGGTVSGAGQYYGNSECTLIATANTGYTFANWTLNDEVVSTEPTYTFTVNGDATYTAHFISLQAHTVTCNAVEHGTISANPTTAYVGDVITLTATPATNYHLDRWIVRDGLGNTINVINNQFTMPDSDVTVSAIFKSGYDVTVFDNDNGTITASATTAQAGTVINLTVTPNNGYTFMEWNVYQSGEPGNAVTVSNNRFTMPACDVTVNAVFGAPGEVQVEVENTVNVGTGTSTSNGAYLPVRSARSSAAYSLTEQIYTASELGAAGTITGIEFYNAGSSSNTYSSVDIYMVSTSNSSFSSNTDWIQPAETDKVYSGSVTFTRNTWNAITFSTPFEYDGTSNVVLIVDNNSGSNYQNVSCYTYNGDSNQSIYIASGTTNFNPTSISSSGTRVSTKNRVNFHITRMETQTQILPITCEEPLSLVYNITPYSADFIWAGESEMYNIRYREANVKFFYDFESADPFAVDDFSPCSTYDGDGSSTYSIQGATFTNQGYTGSFIAFQDGVVNGLYSHGGVAFGACFAATTPPNNDFFILPEITIEDGDIFSFWAMQYTDEYPEAFRVGVYGSSGSFSSYLAGSATTSITPTMDWKEYSYDLSAYAGQTIKLAIQCVSNDAFIFGIDDLYVGNPNAPWIETLADVTTNPYTIEGLTPETVYDVQVQGICSGIGETNWVNATFTTLPICSAPSSLSATNVSALSADLNWTGFVDSYNVQYRTAGGRVLYFYDSFESGAGNWTTSGLANNSGVYSGFPNTGTYMFGFVSNSASQYLITPELSNLEAGSTMAFYHVAYGGNTTIKIGYSSTTNATSAFTWGTAQTISSSSAYDLYSEEIPTGTKYIGIQVTNVAGNYYFIDDFIVAGQYVESGEWHYVNNVTDTHTTITGLTPETKYEWQVQGNCSDGATDWSSSTFTTRSLCDLPIGLSTTDITATSATLNWTQDLDKYNVRFAPISFFEDFENGLDDWTTIRNGAGTENTDWHIVNSASAFSNEAIAAHSGSYVVMSRSYAGQAYSVDNWLISPKVTLDGFLKFWVMDDGEYHEHFDVYVSTTGYDIADFTLLASPGDATFEWTEVSVDLTSFNGVQGYIAIRNIDNDQDFLFLDDFGIYANDWETVNRVNTGYVVNNLEPVTDYVWQVQGNDCDGNGGTTEWSSIVSFTTLFGLNEGWNWWTPITTMSLEDLEDALGSQGVIINSQNGGFLRYEEGEGWSGTLTLTEITPGQMYKIQTTAQVSLSLNGTPASLVEINLLPGYNWFGYTGTTAKAINNALGDFRPADGDKITAENGTTITYSRSSNSWSGDLTLLPGHGYVYYTTQRQTLSF